MQADNYAALTDVGRIREHNEDCYCINAGMGLYVVADGMGGHASGEVAAAIAVNTIEQELKQGAALVDAIELAHFAIIDGVKTGAGKHGMGTTVVAVQLQGNDYTLAWVGDSRAYLWDDGVTQISKDHSLVQMLIDSRQISEAEARVHPRKNIIYQNLGSEDIEELQVSVKRGSLYKNQKILLCSDGLSDEVDNDEINKIIAEACNQCQSEEVLVKKLVDAALDNGGGDNITVVVISASGMAPDKTNSDELQNSVDKDTLVPDENA